MKWLRHVALVALIATLAMHVDSADARKWSDKTGKHSVEGELIDVQQGKAHVRRADGKLVFVDVALLSEDDREYIDSLESSTILEALDELEGLIAEKDYEEAASYCRAIIRKAAAKNRLTAEERYAQGWAHLHLSAAAFERGLAKGGLRPEREQVALKWQESIRPEPKTQPKEGKLVTVSAVAEIEGHTQDRSVATIRIPPQLTLEQFPTVTLKLLEEWIKDGHRLWLCNDVAKAFDGAMGSGNHRGYRAEVLATVKVAPGSHPLIENVSKVLAHSQASVVDDTRMPDESVPYMVAPPTGRPCLGSPEKLTMEKVGDQFVAYAVAVRLGQGELLYIYPGLDYTKYDGPVFKKNVDRHVRTFPTKYANKR